MLHLVKTRAAAPRGNRLDRPVDRRRPLLACYFALGDPVFDDDVRAVYRASGVDIFELGLPSRDPYMDGADVAGAMRRALVSGTDPYTRLADMTDWLAGQEEGPAAVCMAYADVDFARIAAVPGLDGALIVGARPASIGTARTCGLLRLQSAPGDLDEAARWDGYVMAQAADGVTGPRAALDPRLADSIAAARRAGVRRPILAGFGIGTPEQARAAVEAGADGVVIGSMCVRKAVEGQGALQAFLHDVRAALDG